MSQRNSIVCQELNKRRHNLIRREDTQIEIPKICSNDQQHCCLKVGVHINSIFSPLNVGLMKISRSRFKQSKNPLLISRSYVVRCFVNFWVIFGYIWVEIVFLKGLEKFREIRKIEDLMKFKN